MKSIFTSLVWQMFAGSLIVSALTAQPVYQFSPIKDVEINGVWTINGYGPGFVGSDFDFFDVDNDGDLDLFTGGPGGRIYFYRNDSRPDTIQWTLASEFYAGIQVPHGSASPAFGDINGDGLKDLFIGNGPAGGDGGHIAIYLHIGTADSAAWQLIDSMWLGIDVGDRSTIHIADPDFDGDNDVFVGAGGGGQMLFVKNNGTAQVANWQMPEVILQGLGFRTAPQVVDIDQDSMMDLFIAQAYGTIYHYEDAHPDPDSIQWQLKTHTYFPWDVCLNPQGCVSRIRMVDIDGDQDLDCFATSNGYNFFRNIGTPQAPQWRYELPNYPVIGNYHAIADIVDLNGDQKPDLLHPFYHSYTYYMNTGSLQLPAWQFVPDTFTSVFVPRFTEGTFYDWDLDGDVDLICGSANGTLRVFENQGDSTLPHFVPIADPILDVFTHGSSTYPILIDLYKDSQLDLLVCTSTQLYHFADIGTGQHPVWHLETVQFLPLPTGSNSFGRPVFVDLDSDGIQDFYIRDGIYWNHGTDSLPNWSFEESELHYLGLMNSAGLYPHELIPNCGIESMINVGGTFRLYTYQGIQPEILPLSPHYLCSNTEIHQFEVFPNGGYWTGDVDSSGRFSPLSQGAGVYTGIYHFPDPLACDTLTDSISFFVRPGPPPLAFEANGYLIGDTLCLSPTDTIQVLAPIPFESGSWGGVATWPGIIDPAVLDSSLHWATYRRSLNGCTQIDSIPVKLCLPTSQDDLFQVLEDFSCYPNPFSDHLFLRVQLAKQSEIRIRILNSLGQEIKKLADHTMRPGVHQLSWDGTQAQGKDVPGGLYFIDIQTATDHGFEKIHLIR